ncbi:hypothetical protein [Algoriphagus boritolerans]|uniref:hypothetical protein n=1 Tax=Algoriphagus boritolerans TaxID=308111 RepID=UPI002FCE6069
MQKNNGSAPADKITAFPAPEAYQAVIQRHMESDLWLMENMPVKTGNSEAE